MEVQPGAVSCSSHRPLGNWLMSIDGQDDNAAHIVSSHPTSPLHQDIPDHRACNGIADFDAVSKGSMALAKMHPDVSFTPT